MEQLELIEQLQKGRGELFAERYKPVDHTNKFCDAVCSVNWTEGVLPEVALEIQLFLGSLNDDQFMSAYKRIAVPHENIKLVAAINKTCGPRVVNLFEARRASS